jgi:hypothetical protein
MTSVLIMTRKEWKSSLLFWSMMISIGFAIFVMTTLLK